MQVHNLLLLLIYILSVTQISSGQKDSNCLRANPRALHGVFDLQYSMSNNVSIISDMLQLFSTRFDRAYVFIGRETIRARKLAEAATQFKINTNSSLQIFLTTHPGGENFVRNETLLDLQNMYQMVQDINTAQNGTVGGLILETELKTFDEDLKFYEEALGPLEGSLIDLGIKYGRCHSQDFFNEQLFRKLSFIICTTTPNIAKSPEVSADDVSRQCDITKQLARRKQLRAEILCIVGYPTESEIPTGVKGNLENFARFWCRIAEIVSKETSHARIIMHSAFDVSEYSFGWWRRLDYLASGESAYREKIDGIQIKETSTIAPSAGQTLNNHPNCLQSNPRVLHAEFNWINKYKDAFSTNKNELVDMLEVFSTRFDRAYVFGGTKAHRMLRVAMAAAEFRMKTNSALQIFFVNFVEADKGSTANQTLDNLKRMYKIALDVNSIHTGTVGGLILRANRGRYDEDLKFYEEAIGPLENSLIDLGIIASGCTRTKFLQQKLVSKLSFIICITSLKLERTPELSADGIVRQCERAEDFARRQELRAEVLCRVAYPTESEMKNGVTGNLKDFARFWCRIVEILSNKTSHVKIIMQSAFDDNPEHLTTDEWKYSFGWWHRLNDFSSAGDAFEEKIEKIPLTTTHIPHPNDIDSSNNTLVTSLLISVGVLGTVLVVLIAAIVVHLTWGRSEFQNMKLTAEDILFFEEGKPNNQKPNDECLLQPYDKCFEIPKSSLAIETSIVLGKGEHGVVYSGTISNRTGKVAIKTTKTLPSALSAKQLLSEIKILIHVGVHPNVLQFLGANTADKITGIVFIVLELCEMGSLDNIIRQPDKMTALCESLQSESNPMSRNELACKWSGEIACGMHHISSKNVVHADLATRNILLTREGVAKITDFGLSRKLDLYAEYIKQQQEPMPWRWMAPESLKRMIFSTESDVWSFGITLYEIFSGGSQPYSGIGWDYTFIEMLESGYINSQPEDCTDEIFAKMNECWHILPPLRPSFADLEIFFKTFVRQNGYLELTCVAEC